MANKTTIASDLLELNYNKIFGFSSNTTDSFFQLISTDYRGITYQSKAVIDQLEIEEEDYRIDESGVYIVDWKDIIDKYFVCDNLFIEKYQDKLGLLRSGLIDEISNIFVYSKNDNVRHYSQIIKRFDDYIVAMFMETSQLMKHFIKVNDVNEISQDIMKTTSSFFAEIVLEEVPYMLLDESVQNYSLFSFDKYIVDHQIKISLKDFIALFIDNSHQKSTQFYSDKIKAVIEARIDTFSTITKMSTVAGNEQVELYFKTRVTRLESGRIVIVYSDYTEQQLTIEKEELRKITDHFTGLRNRTAFTFDYMETSFKNCVISFVDLKNLEFINEMYDRRTGDVYLSKLGLRLKELGENTVCYRLGGDEFVVVTSDFSTEEVPDILEKISSPIEIAGNAHKVTASMFFVDLAKNQFDNLKDILSILDYTRKTYKDHVAGSCIEVDDHVFINFERQKILYKELSQGFDKNVVYPLFQPYIDTHTKKVIGFESLARIVINNVVYQPSEFIPVLESMNLIYKLDLMMFEESCKMKMKFDLMGGDKQKFIASSNLSPKSFKMVCVKDFEEIVDRYDMDRADVKIELTEQEKMDTYVWDLLEDLTENGFNISIDDFSAGHSSLKYIAEIRSKTLKVDRQLLTELSINSSEKNMIIYKNIVNLAQALDMEVVSEGVETEEQVSILQNIGVNYLQGFFFSRPVNRSEFMEYAIEVNI